MKIAYVHDVIYPYVKGGAEKRVWEISKRLVERGHEVHIYGMKYWDGDEEIERGGVHLHGICPPRELYVDGKRSIKTSIYFSWKLLSSFKEDFDVVDCQQFPYFPCFSAKFRSTLKRTTMLITWHEVWNDYWYEYLGRKGMLGRWVERLTTRLPDKIIPVSERVRGELRSIGVSDEKIEVVPNGVDFQGIQKIKKEDDSFDVIYVGRLSEHKRVDLLVRAISMVKDLHPTIKCGIVGDGPEMNDLVDLAKGLKLEDNIEFFGFVERDEDVTARMKSSKIFVSPSTREGFGITLIEANACGLPVIVVDAEKNAGVDLVEEGKNGLICDISAEGIAAGILKLLKGDSYKKMTDSSREHAKKYDWNRIVDKTEILYNKFI